MSKRKKVPKVFEIHAMWDEEAKVWVATSEDVPGLVTEAATQPVLLENLRELIPELLELNGVTPLGKEIPLSLLYRQSEVLHLT